MPSSPPLEQTLTYRLHLLHKVTDLESQRRYTCDAGLSLADGRCLAAVGRFEPLSVMDLARHANLDKGQASRAAQALVAQGLVSKQGSVTDGRGVTLTLTPAGCAAWERTMAMIHRRNDEIFSCLGPAGMKTLGRLLDQLIAHNS